MSRKRESLSLSLFPFLAVLICTMGVLVALLLLVVKRAEQSADAEAVAEAAAVQQQLVDVELAVAEASLRNQLLESQRSESRERLEHQRGLLGHLDNELASLREQARVLAQQILALQAANDGDSRGSPALAELEQQLAEQRSHLLGLETQIVAAQAELAAVDGAGVDGRAPVYSIVPIAAKSGTNRRPIYIECREGGLYLHPGEISLTLSDFVLPLTPGNPLDAALLAYREYWRRTLGQGAGGGNAYPLMVVRPSGAKWYGVARRAMSGWDREFGYELIPEDWDVNFGPADPGLVTAVEQAIESSRLRQTALVAYGQATPASYQSGSGGAGNGGGVEQAGLTPAVGGGFSTTAMGASGRRRAGKASGSGDGADPIAAFSSQFHTTRGEGSGLAIAEPMASGGGSIWTSSRQTPSAASLVAAAAGNARLSESGRGATAVVAGNASGAGALADPRAEASQWAGGAAAGRSNVETQSESNGGRRTAANAATTTANGTGRGSTATGSNSGGAASLAAPMGAVSAAPRNDQGSAAGSAPSLPVTWNPQAVAHQRGADWALPSRRNAVSAYHRPVRVQVTPSALILAAGEGSPRAETVAWEASLTDAIDPLANAIWRRVDRWGYLGFDGYWKPVLHLEYDPAERGLAEELERLLEGSGLDVQHPRQGAGEGTR